MRATGHACNLIAEDLEGRAGEMSRILVWEGGMNNL